MLFQPNRMLVSCFLPIGGKRETNGNQSGNGEETAGHYLCRNRNEMEMGNGNERSIFGAVRFHSLSSIHRLPRFVRILMESTLRPVALIYWELIAIRQRRLAGIALRGKDSHFRCPPFHQQNLPCLGQ